LLLLLLVCLDQDQHLSIVNRGGLCHVTNSITNQTLSGITTSMRRSIVIIIITCLTCLLLTTAIDGALVINVINDDHKEDDDTSSVMPTSTTTTSGDGYEFDHFMIRPRSKISLYSEPFARYSHHSLLGANHVDTFPIAPSPSHHLHQQTVASSSSSTIDDTLPVASLSSPNEVALPMSSIADMRDELVIVVRPLMSSIGGWAGVDSEWSIRLESSHSLIVTETIGMFSYQQRVSIPSVVPIDHTRITTRSDAENLIVIVPKKGILPTHPSHGNGNANMTTSLESRHYTTSTPSNRALPSPSDLNKNEEMVNYITSLSLPTIERALGSNTSHSAAMLMDALHDFRQQQQRQRIKQQEQLGLLLGTSSASSTTSGDWIDYSDEALAARALEDTKRERAAKKVKRQLAKVAAAQLQAKQEAEAKTAAERAAKKKWNVQSSLASKLRSSSKGKGSPTTSSSVSASTTTPSSLTSTTKDTSSSSSRAPSKSKDASTAATTESTSNQSVDDIISVDKRPTIAEKIRAGLQRKGSISKKAATITSESLPTPPSISSSSSSATATIVEEGPLSKESLPSSNSENKKANKVSPLSYSKLKAARSTITVLPQNPITTVDSSTIDKSPDTVKPAPIADASSTSGTSTSSSNGGNNKSVHQSVTDSLRRALSPKKQKSKSSKPIVTSSSKKSRKSHM
jgi:hypothetical protein